MIVRTNVLIANLVEVGFGRGVLLGRTLGSYDCLLEVMDCVLHGFGERHDESSLLSRLRRGVESEVLKVFGCVGFGGSTPDVKLVLLSTI